MNARQLALKVLERCRRSGAWSGELLDAELSKADLSPKDKALATQLCLSVLQNETLIDFWIDSYCSQKLEPKVRDILRLGMCQIALLDRIPNSAAVNESVNLCKSSNCKAASGLVNAVLRKAASNPLPVPSGSGTPEYLAVQYSHPLWLCRKLCAERGYEFTEEFLRSNNAVPPHSLHVNTLKISFAEYEELLRQAGLAYRAYPDSGCFELSGGVVPKLPGFEEGLFFIQDRAAAECVRMAGLKPGMRVLDACSAPGGKSFAAAIAMENSGEITSCDIHENKLGKIRSGAERLGIGIVRAEVMDASKQNPALLSSFDAVIADVPCSGIGVIRKKPEIRKKTEEEIRRLPEIQAAILNNLAAYVRDGGILMYSTCTVLKEENEAVVDRFLEQHPEFEAEAFELSESGKKTFWPNADGTDGFFAAKLRKKF